MLGEQFGEVKGKITGQRDWKKVYIGRPTNTSGIIHGKGIGVIMAGESELATVTGEGIGRIDSSKNINWRGSLFFSTSSTDKLASLLLHVRGYYRC